MNIKKWGAFLLGLALLFGLGFLATTSVAQATPVPQAVGQCGDTSVSTTRPDSGHHGDWATLVLVRSVHVCRTSENHYTATITDDGTLITLDSASPRQGLPLAAGTTGTVHGTYDWTFVAENLNLDALVSPDPDTKTGVWLEELVKASGGKWCSGSGHEYIWTYITCSEQWVDASSNDDGQVDTAGDITGKACPTPVPSAGSVSFVDRVCHAGGIPNLPAYVIKAATGVTWQATIGKSSDVVVPGTYVVGQNGKAVTVVVEAVDTQTKKVIKSWTHTFPWTVCAKPKPPVVTHPKPKPLYANCDAVRAAHKAPLLRGQPGFTAKLDGNNNGVACEVLPVAIHSVSPVAKSAQLANTGSSAAPWSILIALGALMLGTAAIWFGRSRTSSHGRHHG